MLNNSYEVKLVIKSVFLVLKENNVIFDTLTIETNDYDCVTTLFSNNHKEGKQQMERAKHSF